MSGIRSLGLKENEWVLRAEICKVRLLLAWSAAEALEGVEVSRGGVPWRFVPSVSIWVRPFFTL